MLFICEECGFEIFDLTNPTNPSLTAYNNQAENACDIFVSGDYAYIITDIKDEAFQVFDVSNSEYPARLHVIPLTHANKIAVQGNYAYVQSIGRYLYVIINMCIKQWSLRENEVPEAITVDIINRLLRFAHNDGWLSLLCCT